MTQNPSENQIPRYGEQDSQHASGQMPQNPYGQDQQGQGGNANGPTPYGQDQQNQFPPQNAYGQGQADPRVQGGPQYGQSQNGQNPYGQGQGDPRYGQGQYPNGYGAPQYPGGPQSPGGTGAPQRHYGAPMPTYQGQAPAQATGPAPQTVRRGALLVYIACGIGVVGAVLLALPTLQEAPASAIGSILGNLVVFALGITGAVLTVKGFNWARITSLVFACLSVFRLLVGMFGLIALFTEPLLGIGYLVQVVSTLLYIIGVVFFWLTSSTLWFRSRQSTLY